MYKEDPRFETPEGILKIWRYMNLEKFNFLIKNRMLYFCSITALKQNDPYEGSHYSSKFLSTCAPELAKNFASKINQCGPDIAVNCWHLNEYESMAMWKIYTKEGKGIAILSTVEGLVKSFANCSDSIFIGKIVYTDDPVSHPTGWHGDKLVSVIRKRKCFEFEKELRAFVWDSPSLKRTKDGSALVPVKLDKLIEKVYLSPTSPEELVKKVHNTIKDHNMRIEIERSLILDKPRY